jgi:hypothetical protein
VLRETKACGWASLHRGAVGQLRWPWGTLSHLIAHCKLHWLLALSKAGMMGQCPS